MEDRSRIVDPVLRLGEAILIVEPWVIASIAVITALILMLIFIVTQFVSWRRRTKKVACNKVVKLRLKIGEDRGVARLNTNTIIAMGLKARMRISIWSLKPNFRLPPFAQSYRIDNRVSAQLSYRQDQKLGSDEIELPRRMANKLFGRSDVEVGQEYELMIDERILVGFQDYWFDEDPKVKFQNRFNVMLAVSMMFIGLGLSSVLL